ncbi:hypothetical protein J6590_067124 [Homalodisca vitripennis]|nr:hypothetical protein J6590_067124 [Homalodisca vitripennis]
MLLHKPRINVMDHHVLQRVFKREQLSTPCGSTSGKKQKVQLQLFETEETKNLGNADLQRLVLLEQLQLMRMQKEKENIILAKLKQDEDQQTNVVHDAEKTYFNL